MLVANIGRVRSPHDVRADIEPIFEWCGILGGGGPCPCIRLPHQHVKASPTSIEWRLPFRPRRRHEHCIIVLDAHGVVLRPLGDVGHASSSRCFHGEALSLDIHPSDSLAIDHASMLAIVAGRALSAFAMFPIVGVRRRRERAWRQGSVAGEKVFARAGGQPTKIERDRSRLEADICHDS